jgi:transcriptional regulator with XRE-family HTH domain
MDMEKVTCGDAIRARRLEKNITQKSLSTRCGLSREYIAMIETGKKYPSIKAFARIAAELETTTGELIRYDPHMQKMREIVDAIGFDQLQEMIDSLKNALD